ncbi:hypothetical protein [Eudoraea sp.]
MPKAFLSPKAQWGGKHTKSGHFSNLVHPKPIYDYSPVTLPAWIEDLSTT